MTRYLSHARAYAAVLALSCLAAASHAPNDALMRVNTVYLLPMSNGLDQFLAGEFSRTGAIVVVTDPAKADAVLTDHLGEAFERKMTELYPPPAPPKPAKPAAESAGKDDTKKDDGKDDGKTSDDSKSKTGSKANEETRAEADRLSKENRTPMVSTLGRSRGMVFLVDRRSGNVLWSLFERPKDTQVATLQHTAHTIARHLLADRNPPVKKTAGDGSR